MSNRLDQEREKRLQPKRMDRAIIELSAFAEVTSDNTKVEFEHKGELVKYYPYSGWASGKSIKDGRGLKNLLDQLKQQ